ncbi:MAG: hypothetical protein DRP11_05050 [Candidatus Aenigmatarchaeota archaeon]|nr:MAG: hypothetical protein DRP11_05050 [Candidatus Aenigmarchaeota archaeon]
MKVPSSDLLKRIIKQKLREKGEVETQRELGALVQKELKKINPKLRVTPERVRRVAVEIPHVEVVVETRSGKKLPKVCPVCSSELVPIYMKNLTGKKVKTGFRCSKCSYRGDMKRFVPMRYTFRILKG